MVWLGVLALGWRALRGEPVESPREVAWLVIGGGAVVPTVLLAATLTFSLSMTPALLDPGPADGLRIVVTGEQFWWRVRYDQPGAAPVELANEVRLPVGRRTPVELRSADVIHSFWIPSLAGKEDLIPGRVNVVGLEPTRTGAFRGACAEFCGPSHTTMLLDAVVLEPEAFLAWLADQRRDAAPPESPEARRGQEVFLASGCGACHAVRGLPTTGTLGPDLTHVGSRARLAAGALPNEADAFRRWVADPAHVKEGAQMPGFDVLPPEDLDALAAFLDGLR